MKLGTTMSLAMALAFCGLCANSRADGSVSPGNPYASIVKRNVFALNPIPPPAPSDANPGPPPPKITLTGITTIFGPPEALFRVAGVKRQGQPPKDESYIFTEGEMQDDVEVTAIDTNAYKVTFNNHGVVQEIPLVDGTASTGPAPTPTFPGQNFPMRRFGRFPANDNGGARVFNHSYENPAMANLSPDDRQALIAAQHAQMQAQGNPMANLFPPTKFDQQAQQEAGVTPPGATPPAP